VALAVMSCGRPDPPQPTVTAHPAESSASVARPTPSTIPRIVILGDSLTAGLGIPRDEAYPTLLQRKIHATGHRFEVINAGISGDTSADGLRRLNWALEGDVRLLIVALGANDALRGLPAAQMKENLQGIIHRARQRGISVLLVGMEAPPNYGEQYAAAFRQVFQELARENKVPLVPFLLEGVAGRADLNQPDGIHPTSAGAARIAEHLWPSVSTLIQTTR
jgi:acyl-CoA thioesterase I